MLEQEWRDANLCRLELVEDFLRVVRAIVLADARVIASDDDVCAAIVLAADRVKDRFARTGVPHRRRKHAEDHAVGRIVIAQEFLVRTHPHVGRDIVRLGFADERMEKQAVHDFERGLLNVLVRAVDRVARLKRDDALPPARGEHLASGEWRVAKLWELEIIGKINYRNITRQIDFALLVESRDAGMLVVGRAVHILRLARFSVLEFLRECHHREQMPIGFGQRDFFADVQRVGARACDRQRDRNAPHQASRQAHVFDNRVIVALAHKAGQR